MYVLDECIPKMKSIRSVLLTADTRAFVIVFSPVLELGDVSTIYVVCSLQYILYLYDHTGKVFVIEDTESAIFDLFLYYFNFFGIS